MRRALPILCLALTLAACQQSPRSESAAAPVTAGASLLTPEQLGALGAKIRREPSRADELLQQHGLTRAAFEKQIRDVTENVESAQRYAAGYRKASA